MSARASAGLGPFLALALSAGASRSAPPVLAGTGVPWLNEKPSSGTAIWPSTGAAALGSTGTLHLAVIRVEFVEDFDPETTGDGRFDLGTSPPHDRDYTIGLAQDMADYMHDASGGRFDIDFTVFPLGGGAYEMPHQMAWYGADSNWVAGVCMLLRDAVQASDGDVDFSAFGAVMVVHAGAGQEADVLANSPDDVSSVFLTLADLAYYLPEGGYGYQGIETDDGVFVQEGTIIPEQESQDGYGFGVLGTMAHETLHQLGLPDLYDTLTGGVGVGGWDIMGYGQWLMSGFWPSEPGAWSRIRLGWADLKTVEGGTFESITGDSVLKIPLSGTEYLLVENRERDPDGDGMCDSSERDFGLPGSGVLIWHVDQGVIDEKIGSNTVNTDPAHKGVDLEEADGIQDFDYSLPDLYGYEGSRYDPWFQGGYGSLFGPGTTPSSETSWGGATGVSVGVQDPPGLSMTVSVSSDLMPPGWPAALDVLSFGPVPVSLQDGPAVLLTSPVGVVWALPTGADPSPHAFFDNASCPPVADASGGPGQVVLICTTDGGVHMLGGDGAELPGWPAEIPGGRGVASMLCNGGYAAVASDRNRIYLFDPAGNIVPGWPRVAGEEATGLAFIPDSSSPGIVALTRSGTVLAWGLDGLPLPGWPVDAQGGEPTGSPLVTDFDRDGSLEIAAVCGRSVSVFGIGGAILSGLPAELRGDPLGSPWLADINDDGHPEVVVETTKGVEALEATGAVLLDWPLMPPIDPSSGSFSRSCSGTGAAGFAAFALRDGRVGIAGSDGRVMDGFPVSTGDDPVGRPALADFDGDGLLEMVEADASGYVGMWQTPIPVPEHFPGSDFSGRNCWSTADLPPVWDSGGLLTGGSFFVYPNPVREGAGRIRFEPGRDSMYRVRVFDVAGEQVSDFSGSCEGGMACELQWDVSDLSPGLYYVCLELTGSGGRAQALFQAAVVH